MLLLFVFVICFCYLFLLYVFVICFCYLFLLFVFVICFCYLFLLYVFVICFLFDLITCYIVFVICFCYLYLYIFCSLYDVVPKNYLGPFGRRMRVPTARVKIVFFVIPMEISKKLELVWKKRCLWEKSTSCRQIRGILRAFYHHHTIFPVFTYMVLFLTAQLLRGGLTPRKFLFSSYGAPNVPKINKIGKMCFLRF